MLIDNSHIFENKVTNFIKYKVLQFPFDIKIKGYHFVTGMGKLHIYFYYSNNHPKKDWRFIGQDIYINYDDIIQFDRIQKIEDILC